MPTLEGIVDSSHMAIQPTTEDTGAYFRIIAKWHKNKKDPTLFFIIK
jgi:hypothetical protein